MLAGGMLGAGGGFVLGKGPSWAWREAYHWRTALRHELRSVSASRSLDPHAHAVLEVPLLPLPVPRTSTDRQTQIQKRIHAVLGRFGGNQPASRFTSPGSGSRPGGLHESAPLLRKSPAAFAEES